MKFVHFTAPNGKTVEVKADNVVSFRECAPGECAPGAKTLIVLMSGFQAVRESLDEVESKLGDPNAGV